MKRFGKRLKRHIDQLQMTQYKLAKLSKLSNEEISSIILCKRRASDRMIKQMTNVPQLHLTEDTLKGWRAADEYNLQQLQIAAGVLSEESP